MKKIIFASILGLFLLGSCTDYDETYDDPDETGVGGMEDTDNELEEEPAEEETEVID